MLMTPLLLTLATCLVFSGEPPTRTETPRQPNPLAPSLPLLTDDEENQLDQTIDRFIDAESGKLRGADAKKAQSDFQKLGPEAIPALIRGLNRAARIDHSCPAVIIAKKLARMFSTTKDPELLQFARENIAAGVTQSRHLGVIKDLRSPVHAAQADRGPRTRPGDGPDLAGLTGGGFHPCDDGEEERARPGTERID